MAAVRVRKRGLAIGLMLFGGLAALLWLALSAAPQRSPRVQTVERLMAATRAKDMATFSKLVPGNVTFWVLSDVLGSVTPENLGYFAERCRVQDIAEGADTVAVSLACVGAKKRKILDFTFCGDRISMVEHVEWGRWILSPIPRDLFARVFGQTKATCPAPR
jgi:hypothetical protein